MPSPSRAGEVADLEHARREDDRRREQEREAGRVLVGELREQARADRGAGAADPGQQREDLRGADQHGREQRERRDPGVRALLGGARCGHADPRAAGQHLGRRVEADGGGLERVGGGPRVRPGGRARRTAPRRRGAAPR